MAWSATTGPSPDSSPYAIWGAVANDVWCGGGNAGSLAHWNGSTWSDVPYGGTTPISIFGFSATDIWVVEFAVGSGPKTFHWDGSSWSAVLSTSAKFLSVFGVASNDVWACGTGGAMWHWDGSSWSSVATGSAEDLFGLYGFATDDVWAVGTTGTTLHWDGATWSAFSNGLGLTTAFRAIHGVAADNVLLVGDRGVLAHWDGAAWSQIGTGGFGQDFTAIFMRVSDDIWIAGDFDFFLHIDNGSSFQVHPVTEDDGFTANWNGGANTGLIAFAADDAWAVNASIQRFHWSGPGIPAPAPPVPPSPTVQVNDTFQLPQADLFGLDFKSVPDASFSPISGQRVVAEALYRRFTSARGSNPFHPDDCLDVRNFLNDDITTDGLFAMKSALEREAEKDERVFAINVTVDFNPATFTLKLSFAVTTAGGPFAFLLTVDKLTTTLLFQGP